MPIISSTSSRSSRALAADVWADFRLGFGQFLAFDLVFKVAASTVLLPLVTWLLSALISTSGRLALTNAQLLSFALSPVGFITLIVAITAVFAFAFAEEAGLIYIAADVHNRRRASVIAAIVFIARRAPSILRLGALQGVLYVLALAPFAAAAALAYSLLLTRHDINYFITDRPPEFWAAALIGALLLLGGLVVFAVLYLRWIFSLAVLLFERVGPVTSLQGSRSLGAGAKRRVVAVLGSWAIVVAISPAIATLALDAVGAAVFARLGEGLTAALITVALLMTIYVVVLEAVTLTGLTVNALLIVHLYRELRQRKGLGVPELLDPSRPSQPEDVVGLRGRRGRLIAGTAVLLVLVSAASSLTALTRLRVTQQVEITAHRGSSGRAPENTLSAIEAAIEDGADYAEIDVQETADGVVVLLHDEDLLRIAGVERKIWEISYGELRELDAGRWFSSDFEGERFPTLVEAIDLARGRIKLNIELKFNGHDQRLAERVAEIVQQKDFASEALISSLDYGGLMKIREVNPGYRLGYMIFESAGDITRLDVDVLSVNARNAGSKLVVSTRRAGKELHVWTVDDSGQMSRFIDLGVDNIITNEPAMLRDMLDERAELSEVEILVLAFRTWLRT